MIMKFDTAMNVSITGPFIDYVNCLSITHVGSKIDWLLMDTSNPA